MNITKQIYELTKEERMQLFASALELNGWKAWSVEGMTLSDAKQALSDKYTPVMWDGTGNINEPVGKLIEDMGSGRVAHVRIIYGNRFTETEQGWEAGSFGDEYVQVRLGDFRFNVGFDHWYYWWQFYEQWMDVGPMFGLNGQNIGTVTIRTQRLKYETHLEDIIYKKVAWNLLLNYDNARQRIIGKIITTFAMQYYKENGDPVYSVTKGDIGFSVASPNNPFDDASTDIPIQMEPSTIEERFPGDDIIEVTSLAGGNGADAIEPAATRNEIGQGGNGGHGGGGGGAAGYGKFERFDYYNLELKDTDAPGTMTAGAGGLGTAGTPGKNGGCVIFYLR